MNRTFFVQVENAVALAEQWLARNPGPIRAVTALVLAFFAFWLISIALPLFIAVALLAAVLLLARAWLREFAFLMGADDSAFPGRNDKLIWALLLVVLPPVGVFLFRAHRRAYWPESDAKAAQMADELA